MTEDRERGRPHGVAGFPHLNSNTKACMCTGPCCFGKNGCMCHSCSGVGHVGCPGSRIRAHKEQAAASKPKRPHRKVA